MLRSIAPSARPDSLALAACGGGERQGARAAGAPGQGRGGARRCASSTGSRRSAPRVANEQVTLVGAGHRADRAAQFRRRRLRPPRPGRRRAPAGAGDRRSCARPRRAQREAQQQLRAGRGAQESRLRHPRRLDTQVAARRRGARPGAGHARRDRRAGDPRALLGLGLAAQHLGRRDRQPGHRDRDDQRHRARSSSISPCPRRCSPRSGRA